MALVRPSTVMSPLYITTGSSVLRAPYLDALSVVTSSDSMEWSYRELQGQGHNGTQRWGLSKITLR